MAAAIPSEVDAAVSAFVAGAKPGDAVIFACDLKSKTLAVKETLSEADVEDITDELASTPRLILYCQKVELDAVQALPYSFFLHYNPIDAPIQLKRLYQATVREVAHKYRFADCAVREVELNDEADFNMVWLAAKVRGLTGKMGAPLPGQFSPSVYKENSI